MSQEKRNLQGHTTEVAASKGFFFFFVLSPVSMGRTPEEQLHRRAMAPHERFGLEAGEADHLIVKKVNCFPPLKSQKAQEEQHHGVWDTSKYLTDFSRMK